MHNGTFDEYSKHILDAFEPRQVDGLVTWQDLEHGISHARIHLFRGDREKLRDTLVTVYGQFADTETPLDAKGFYEPIFGTPPNPDILATLKPAILSDAFKDLAHTGMQKLQNLQPLWELMQQRKAVSSDLEHTEDSGEILETQTLYCLLTGQLDALDVAPDEAAQNPANVLLESIRHLIHSGVEASLEIIGMANGGQDGANVISLNHELTVLPTLALIASPDSSHMNVARLALTQSQRSSTHTLLQQYLESVATGVLTVRKNH
jgi:hypothetical protein